MELNEYKKYIKILKNNISNHKVVLPEDFPKELFNDKKFVKLALHYFNQIDILGLISDELKNDEDLLEYLIIGDCGFGYLPTQIRSKREIMLKAVKIDGLNLEFADENLKDDRKIVLEAVKQNGRALEFASKNLQADREIVLEAVKQDGRALEFASKNLQADKEIVFEAVKNNGRAFEFASKELQNDRELLLLALKTYGMALEFASPEFLNDREIVLEAVNHPVIGNMDSYSPISLLSNELIKDKEILLKAARQTPVAVNSFPKELMEDKDFVIELFKVNKYLCGNGEISNYDMNKYLLDKDILIAGLLSGMYIDLYDIPEKFKDDIDVVKAVIINKKEEEGGVDTLNEFASDELKKDVDLYIFALEADNLKSYRNQKSIDW